MTLNQTESPINREERLKINRNWDTIQTRLNNLQQQINFISDVDNLDEIITRIDAVVSTGETVNTQTTASLAALTSALEEVELLIPELESNVQISTQLTTDLTALKADLEPLKAELETLKTELDAAATAEAERVANETARKTAEAERVANESERQAAETLREQTKEEMQTLIDNMEFEVYNNSTTYNFPNMVAYNGSTYIALKEVTGVTPTNDGINYRLVAQRGTDGEGAVSSVNGIAPDENGNVTIETGGEVINNLTSTATDKALSANMGKTINDDLQNYKTTANAERATLQTKIGDLTTLQTTSKNSLVEAINENFTQVVNGKTVISNAINDKGGSTTADDTFAELAQGISEIETGIDTSDATATDADILSGKFAYAKGVKVNGTMPVKSAQTYTPTTTNQTIASGRYLTGTQTILGDVDLIPANIKSGVDIFGVVGTLTGLKLASGTIKRQSTTEITVTGLSFRPKIVIGTVEDAGAVFSASTDGSIGNVNNISSSYAAVTLTVTTDSFTVTSTLTFSGGTYKWVAIG